MFENAPLTWHTALSAWSLPAAAGVLVAALAALYLWGVSRAEQWRIRCTAAFLTGLALMTISLGSSINSYSGVLFSMHMAQHLLLITVVPALLILGRPLELLRRTATGRLRIRLRRLADSRVVAVLTQPLVGLAYYAVVVAGTHLTPFLQGVLTHPGLHVLEEFFYLSSGYIQLLPILGTEPIRRQLPHFTRLVVLLLSMMVDTGVGVILMMTPRMPFPAYLAQHRDWGPSPVQDLHSGGAAMWVGGDMLMTMLVIVVIATWVRAPSGMADLGPWLESARRASLAGADPGDGGGLSASKDLDSDDEALRAYNEMLSRLNEPHRPPN